MHSVYLDINNGGKVTKILIFREKNLFDAKVAIEGIAKKAIFFLSSRADVVDD